MIQGDVGHDAHTTVCKNHFISVYCIYSVQGKNGSDMEDLVKENKVLSGRLKAVEEVCVYYSPRSSVRVEVA